MSDIRIRGQIELNVEKATQGVIDLQTQLKKTGDTTKSVQKQTNDFSSSFMKGFKSLGDGVANFGEKLGQSLTAGLGPIGLLLTAIAGIVTIFKKAIDSNESASRAFKKLGDTLSSVLEPALKAIAKVAEVVASVLIKTIHVLSGVSKETLELRERQKALNAEIERNIELREKANTQAIETLVKASIAQELRASKSRLENLRAELQMYENIRAENAGIIKAYDELVRNGDKLTKQKQNELYFRKQDLASAEIEIKNIKEQIRLEELASANNVKSTTAIKARNDLLTEYALKMRSIAGLTSDIANEDERALKIHELKKQYALELEKGLVSIAESLGATRDSSVVLYQELDKIRSIIATLDSDKHTRELEMQAEFAKIELGYLESIESVKRRILLGAITEADSVEAITKLTREYNENISDIADRYSDISSSIDLAKSKMKEVTTETASFKAHISDLVSGFSQIATQGISAVQSLITSTLDSTLENINKILDARKQAIDEHYAHIVGVLEKERQVALEMAGFVEAVTEEGRARATEIAKASGDLRIIYEEKRRQEELDINIAYDQKLLKAQKQADIERVKVEQETADKVSQVNYELALAQWGAQLLQATASIATGIAMVIAQTGVGASVAAPIIGALGAVQLGIIGASIPQRARFAQGGIAGLPETYAGGGIVRTKTPRGVDAVNAIVGNREMILNDEQQVNLFEMLQKANTNGEITVNLLLDSQIISKVVLNELNSGRVGSLDSRIVRA